MATRREFLATATATVVAAFARRGSAGQPPAGQPPAGQPPAPPHRALRPVADETTGEALLKLPPDFSYKTLSWSLSGTTDDGNTATGLPDGMGAFADPDGKAVTLVRNHEITLAPLLAGAPVYDRRCGGGTTTLRFDLSKGEWLSSRASLAGTYRNCSGGPTPWGSWLTCEETVADPATHGVERPHGYVFEVPSSGNGDPRPIVGLGRFVHEAAAVDPRTGIVYLTEDEYRAGLYRFVPDANVPTEGTLRGSGRLQMLAIEGHRNFRGPWRVHHALPVTWVDVDDPAATRQSVFRQGALRGGMSFRRLEGCWYDDGHLYFVSTNGGRARKGQIWDLHVVEQRLSLLYESPRSDALHMPDNLTTMPDGSLLLCENSDYWFSLGWLSGQRARPMRLRRLSPAGDLTTVAENNIVLDGLYGLRGDYRQAEWCGVCRAADWVFANIQKPGITFAITGPWDDIA